MLDTTIEKEIYQLTDGTYVEAKETEFGQYVIYSDYEEEYDPTKHVDESILDMYVGKPQDKIPNRLWNQMVTFFMYYLAQGTEVECRYYKKDNEFICVVSNQTVTQVGVNYDYTKPIYGLDGKEYTRESLVKDGWVLYAHFHLHPFDMANPSSIDDNGANGAGGELKLPLLYGIVSIPTDRASDKHYRIRTTVVAHNGIKNRRYFTNSWDFIELPTEQEVHAYTQVPYADICKTQVKRFVYTPAKFKSVSKKQGANIKLTQRYLPTGTTNLQHSLTIMLESLLYNGYTIKELEQELSGVMANLSQSEELDMYELVDPFYYNGGS
jgi:hypothetical protein